MTAAENETDNLRNHLNDIQGWMLNAQVMQAYDSQWVKKNAEYQAYENWQTAIELLESSTTDLAEKIDGQHEMQKQLDAAKEALRLSVDRYDFDVNKEEKDRVQGLYDDYMTSLSGLRETVNHLNGDNGLSALQSDYETKRDARIEEATQIYEASGQTVSLPEYDATTGWPEWVEPPELSTSATVTAPEPTTVENSDGTSTTTTTNDDGSTTAVTTGATDGSSTTTTTQADGSWATETTDGTGAKTCTTADDSAGTNETTVSGECGTSTTTTDDSSTTTPPV